ncbi:MAG: helix-turn-helix domain-containing protein [Thermoguttaceae bacterium]
MKKLRDFLTVSEAAEFLGVSAATLRNWDRAGKVRATRHPVNGYRLYRKEDLLSLLQKVKHGSDARTGV